MRARDVDGRVFRPLFLERGRVLDDFALWVVDGETVFVFFTALRFLGASDVSTVFQRPVNADADLRLARFAALDCERLRK